MNILITGGAGFIGSHLASSCLQDGHRIRVLDDLSTGRVENLQEIADGIELVEGDICDIELVRKVLAGVDAVFHQGAIPSVPRSFQEPHLFNEVNVTGSLQLILESVEAGVGRIVMASSSSVYGDTEELPKVETDTPMPLSPYAVGKLAAEAYGEVFSKIADIEVVSLRYFNVFGTRQPQNSQYAAVIPSFITSALKGESLRLEGDGEQTRDFTYVEDVVRANLLALEIPKAAGEVFNISGNCRVSLNELIELLNELLPDREMIISHQPPRKGDIRHSWADISKAKEILDYQPEIDLEEGLRRTISHLENELALGRI